MIFDHLGIDEMSRLLISRACGDAEKVFLAPMDKGLSGSLVWLAQWEVHSQIKTKYHVFKIGDKKKITRECRAMESIANELTTGFPHWRYYEYQEKAMIDQEFQGCIQKDSSSLREYIIETNDIGSIEQKIHHLYCDEMQNWHKRINHPDVRKESISTALDWWISRMDINTSAKQIGYKGLNKSIKDRFGIKLRNFENQIKTIGNQQREVIYGPVHGDLHSQNVIFDDNNTMHLIDFGWTGIKWRAIDFLMMECSLKFVVLPPNSKINDLLLIDEILNNNWGNEKNIDDSVFSKKIHGYNMRKILSAIRQVRICCQKSGAVNSVDDYLFGLILLTAGLASLPKLTNKVYLFHSLGYLLSLYN